jgi:NAD(P)-dependent dehydrogenase (short-subunit alcohol dehydrogenase family)
MPDRAFADLVLFLASDPSKYMTGTSVPIDAGCMIKWPKVPGQ